MQGGGGGEEDDEVVETETEPLQVLLFYQIRIQFECKILNLKIQISKAKCQIA